MICISFLFVAPAAALKKARIDPIRLSMEIPLTELLIKILLRLKTKMALKNTLGAKIEKIPNKFQRDTSGLNLK